MVLDRQFMPYDLYLECTCHDVDSMVNNVINFYHWCASRLMPPSRQYYKAIHSITFRIILYRALLQCEYCQLIVLVTQREKDFLRLLVTLGSQLLVQPSLIQAISGYVRPGGVTVRSLF